MVKPINFFLNMLVVLFEYQVLLLYNQVQQYDIICPSRRYCCTCTALLFQPPHRHTPLIRKTAAKRVDYRYIMGVATGSFYFYLLYVLTVYEVCFFVNPLRHARKITLSSERP